MIKGIADFFPLLFSQEVVTLTLAVVVTHDELSTINAIGLVICLIGISLHVTLKVTEYLDHFNIPIYLT